jgi:hypothetical protein
MKKETYDFLRHRGLSQGDILQCYKLKKKSEVKN